MKPNVGSLDRTLRWCPAYLPFGLSTCKRR